MNQNKVKNIILFTRINLYLSNIILIDCYSISIVYTNVTKWYSIFIENIIT